MTLGLRVGVTDLVDVDVEVDVRDGILVTLAVGEDVAVGVLDAVEVAVRVTVGVGVARAVLGVEVIVGLGVQVVVGLNVSVGGRGIDILVGVLVGKGAATLIKALKNSSPSGA